MKKTVAAIACALALCVIGAGDDPTSKPTKKPATTQTFESIAKTIPANMKPPRGSYWTNPEANQAVKWLSEQVKDRRVTFPRVLYRFIGDGDFDGYGLMPTFNAFDIEWSGKMTISFAEEDRLKARSVRKDKKATVTGIVVEFGWSTDQREVDPGVFKVSKVIVTIKLTDANIYF